MSELRDVPESWPVRASRDLFRDDWVMALRGDSVEGPDGAEPFRRLVLEHPGAVAVVALDDRDRVLVLHQYRHPVQRRLVEIPAGLLDVSREEPLAAAQRELAEETGLAADEWSVLLDVLASPGISTEECRIFLARGLHEVAVDFRREHEEAAMTQEWVPLADLVEAVLAGAVRDALAVSGALAVWARRME